ncbi:MAG: phosphoribosylamine--glycine ligase [Bacteroidales bacterium]|jgi:phosphoribosylamine--glycine ligase|nr:phosphoribosylamine--glycine ligase [Bacteroidales bacterium]
MKILLLGSGGREHALAWKIKQSPLCEELYIAPGNAGTSACGTNIPLSDSDIDGIKEFIVTHNINMLVVGPEQPLVMGIYNNLREDSAINKDIIIIGPSEEGAKLEGSKNFAKEFMKRHNIPTAAYQTFTADTLKEGYAFLQRLHPPYVLKADGLAAGKGVIICNELHEAQSVLESMLVEGQFGAASNQVVIEQFLTGIELSVFVLTDGQSYVILPCAKDYKRIGEGDTGLNTGGMGAVSPVSFADARFMDKVEQRIIIPTIKGIQKENINYKGFIFFGLMNVWGDPFVIEYNVRLGDPETEAILPRMTNDLVELFIAVGNQTLHSMQINIIPESAATVMLVSGGYPADYEKGKIIYNMETIENSLVFHAGTKHNEAGDLITAGGRVLTVTSLGKNIKSAVVLSNQNAEKIKFENKQYRKDIGKDLML